MKEIRNREKRQWDKRKAIYNLVKERKPYMVKNGQLTNNASVTFAYLWYATSSLQFWRLW